MGSGSSQAGALPPQGAAPKWGQIAGITVGAVMLYAALRLLPTGTNLSHMDFRVDAKGANSIEFCDPLNPQFIPVVAVRSPIEMNVATRAAATVGQRAEGVVTLRTSSGKEIAPEDLQVMHTRKLHLLIVDPTLADYQHVHPEPGSKAGEWTFAFTPHAGGAYRVFADFTPVATGRGLYASADLTVSGSATATNKIGSGPAATQLAQTVERDGYRFTLTFGATPKAGQPLDLQFGIVKAGGGEVPLEPVMDAFAHLVAFDETRSGFAHLHPMEADVTKKPDAAKPVLNFKLTIPSAGRYVIWAQMNLGGREEFVPFDFRVE